jgi:ATP-dependent RNA helicase RhlE
MFVLDEADQMLDMGFIHDIKKIANLLPERRQNLMFTATFSNSFRSLAREMADKAIEISVTSDGETGENIEHYVHPVDKSRKAELLIELIETKKWDQALVFTRTKHGADRLQKQLDKVSIKSKAIHGNKTQNNRMKALDDFKNNRIKILVATDVAARGIDIKKMSQVINFDVPTVAKDYIHRIGRTGRGGDKGTAISLVSADEFRLLRDIEKLLNQKLERIEIDGFEPEHLIPTKEKPQKKNFHNKAGFRNRKRNRKG